MSYVTFSRAFIFEIPCCKSLSTNNYATTNILRYSPTILRYSPTILRTIMTNPEQSKKRKAEKNTNCNDQQRVIDSVEKHDAKDNSQGDASAKTVKTDLAKMTYASAVLKQNTSVINDRRRGSSEERSEEH